MNEIKQSCSYFQNRECEFFPCHKMSDCGYFNCLFCYCPLYTLGDKCGGNYSYTEQGIKDCSNCILPHSKMGFNHITKKFPELSKLAKNNTENNKS